MACNFTFSLLLALVICVICFVGVISAAEKKKEESKEDGSQKWKKKDVRDYTDADIERLYDQWEDGDDDPLEEDELPEYKREPPKIDMSKISLEDPEGMLKMTKKGRSLMMFASVSGNPTQDETEKITQIWHSSLFNANYETQRYVVSESRVIFMLKDGASAWEVKNFLVQQERCSEVTIEGKSYPGRGATGELPEEEEKVKKDKVKKQEKEKKKETKGKKKEEGSKKKEKTKKKINIDDNRTTKDEL